MTGVQTCALPIFPKELMNGDYEASDRYRLDFQLWVQQLWEEKDRRLETMRKQYN